MQRAEDHRQLHAARGANRGNGGSRSRTRCGAWRRGRSRRSSGSSKPSPSRLAAAQHTVRWSPALICSPPISKSAVAYRPPATTGVSYAHQLLDRGRAAAPGRRCSRWRWSGWRASQSTMHDSDAATVSRPGEHEQERDVDDVLTGERLAVDLGGDEAADEVVTRLAACLAAVELGVEVLDHLRVGGDAVVVVVGPDDPVLEPDEEVEVVEGQAEQGEEHHRRQRLAERVVELDPAVGDEAVDELVGQRAHAWSRAAATTFGANSGSSSLRYFVCSSPSSISGMSGRPAPMYAAASSTMSGSIEWTSRRFVTQARRPGG